MAERLGEQPLPWDGRACPSSRSDTGVILLRLAQAPQPWGDTSLLP